MTNYPNLEKIYLFDFTPGHAGDFFITLASKCSTEFVNGWTDMGQVTERMQEFERTKLFPGNNIGGKLIDFDTHNEYRDVIQADLDRIGPSDRRFMSFCTHPTGNNHSVRISDVLTEMFPNVPLQRVALSISTDISMAWTVYNYYNDFSQHVKSTITRTQDERSRFIYWEDPMNTLVIDHIDLLINDPVKLKHQVLEIAEYVDWDFFNYAWNAYHKVKVNSFVKWWEKYGKNK